MDGYWNHPDGTERAFRGGCTTPAISAVALVPIPDHLFGELPKAFVQLREGHEASTQTVMSLLDHVRGNLARFKIPPTWSSWRPSR